MTFNCATCGTTLTFDGQVWTRLGAIVAVSGMRCKATNYTLPHSPIPATSVNGNPAATPEEVEAWLATA